MAGRALVFSDPEISGTIAQSFIAVAGDDWYRRRQQDRVGEFYRGVIAQRDGQWDGDSTRQGLYCFTAEGKLLAYRNTNSPEHVRRLLKQALERWGSLEPAAREARELAEERGQDDRRFARPLDPSTAILRVHARELDLDPNGGYRKAPGRGMFQNLGSVDHLWLRDGEWRKLLPPKELAVGETYDADSSFAARLARFHLVDNTRGEPNHWRPSEIRRLKLRLKLVARAAAQLELALEGEFELATSDGQRGYAGRIDGALRFDRNESKLLAFDAVVIGEHWGSGTYTPQAREGRTPLGIALTLADGSRPSDAVPPQAARNAEEYFSQR